MQDEIIYTVKLTNEEYEFIEKLKQNYYKKLRQKTKEERLQYFRDNYCKENNLNFEKEINGTTYKVNAHFTGQSTESIFNTIFRLTKNS